VLSESLAQCSDRQLLDRFIESGNDAAFAVILDRHGPMLLGLCRRSLDGATHLAEDVLQATFLVLARKARSIRRRDSLVGWLCGVAGRLARQARSSERAQTRREQRAARERPEAHNADPAWEDLLRVLDAELQRLPDRYRAPLLLCYLEGRTQDEAASQLGWSLSTLRRRLESGRDLLKARMTGRGATLGAGLFAGFLAPSTARAVQTAELRRAVLAAATGAIPGTAVSPSVLALASGGMRMTTLTKISLFSALAVVLSGVLAGVGWMVARATPPGSPAVQARRALLENPPEAAGPRAEASKPAPGRDRFNDPLPAGALARLGTVAFRHGRTGYYWLTSLTFTPDGKHLISQGGGWVRRWDLANGQATVNLGDGWRSGRVSSCLLVSADGRLACICRDVPGGDGTDECTEHDLSSGKKVRAYRLAFSRGLAYHGFQSIFAPDGKTCAELTGTITLWSAADGALVRRFEAKDGLYTAMAFAHDGKTLVAGDDVGTIHVFSVATGKEQRSFGVANVKGTAALAISPDGKRLAAVGGGDGFLRLWDLIRGTEERALDLPEGELPGGAGSIVFSPDSRTLIAGVRKGVRTAVRSWDVLSGKPGRAWVDDPTIGLIPAVSPDGKLLATMNDAGVIRLWDVETGKEKHPREASPCGLQAVCFQPDGKALWTLGTDFALRKWEAATGRLLGKPLALVRGSTPEFVAGGRLVSSRNGKVVLHDATTGKVQLSAPGDRGIVAPDGQRLATTSPDGAVFLYDVETGKLIHTRALPAQRDTPGGPRPVVRGFTADGKFLILQGDNVLVWDVQTGKQKASWSLWRSKVLEHPETNRKPGGGPGRRRMRSGRSTIPDGGGRPQPDFEDKIESVALSPDGSKIAFGVRKYRQPPAQTGGEVTEYRRLMILETMTAKLLHQADVEEYDLLRMAFSPDGKLLAMGGAWTASVWEVGSARAARQFTGHRGRINALAFSADGKRLATASEDSTVLIWDLSARPE
jgi:RNA polymerase sigma factor (sigma-70 family)